MIEGGNSSMKVTKNRVLRALGPATALAVLMPLMISAAPASAATAVPTSHAGAAVHTTAVGHVSPAGTIDGGFSLISSNSGGANLRAAPTMNSKSYEYLGNGTLVLMICWITGQTVSPPNSNYTSNRWFEVEPEYDPTVGYVHSSLVTDQANVREC
jgi:hypothetical protein